ncbi:MAG: AAA family ATPase [Candidatus Limnocylindrales bacterium]
MRIDEIGIDGFGLIHDRRITPGPGLTLIRGENEAGKSTLLAFIRTILFGFETRGHPALAGGRRGGWLSVSTGDGRQIRIERYGLTGGAGQLRVLDPAGADLGADLLPRVLQGVERTVYNNVFAFGLAELAQFANLTSAEINARIYGAGMGTGATSVVELENRLEKRRSDLFVKAGRIPRINVLLGEIDGLDAQIEAIDPPALFRAAGGRRAELEIELVGLAGEAEAGAVARARLERLRDGWPAWLRLGEARARASELPSALAGRWLPADNLLERLARAESSLATATDHAATLAGEQARLTAERDAASIDETLLAARPAIEQLLGAVPGLRADRSRIADLDHDREERTAALSEALRRLGSDWDEARLLTVDDSLGAQGAIAGPFRTSLESAERDLATARLEHGANEQGLADARAELATIEGAPMPTAAVAAGWAAPAADGLLGPALLIGLLLGAIVGGASLQFGLAAGPAAILAAAVVGLVAGVLLRRQGRAGPAVDPAAGLLAARLDDRRARVGLFEQRSRASAERLEAAAAAGRERRAEWRAWLTERGLDPEFDRETAGRILDAAVAARSILAARQGIDARLTALGLQVAATEAQVGALLDSLGRSCDDPIVGLETLRRELAASAGAESRRASAVAALGRIELAITAGDDALRAARTELTTILDEGGAEDPDGLRSAVAEAGRRARVEGEVRAAETTLAALSGPGDALVAFEADLAGYADLGRIQADLSAATEHGRTVEAQRSAILEDLGAERGRINALEHSAEAAELRQRRADLVAELDDLAWSWSVSTIALALLRRTRNRYEREHRPEVLKTAEALLAGWTDGRYVRIRAPLGRQVEELERPDGTAVPISGLSTGTAEQLYLALRFGLVEHFAREAETLPIVMDDILVNFDPDRAERAARSIEDLARRHQVLYFTCHPDTPLVTADTIDLATPTRH